MAHAHPEGGGGQQPVTFDDFQNFMDSLSGGSSGGQPGVSGGTASFPGSFIGVSPSPFGGPAARRESSRVMLENAGQFGERQAATLDPILKTLMQALGFGGGGGGLFGGGPSRSDLLDPRLAQVEAQRKRGEQRVGATAGAQGRNVSGSVFQDAIQQLNTGAISAGQEAAGSVDTLLAQLGLGQQGIFAQLIQALLGSIGGFQLA